MLLTHQYDGRSMVTRYRRALYSFGAGILFACAGLVIWHNANAASIYDCPPLGVYPCASPSLGVQSVGNSMSIPIVDYVYPNPGDTFYKGRKITIQVDSQTPVESCVDVATSVFAGTTYYYTYTVLMSILYPTAPEGDSFTVTIQNYQNADCTGTPGSSSQAYNPLYHELNGNWNTPGSQTFTITVSPWAIGPAINYGHAAFEYNAAGTSTYTFWDGSATATLYFWPSTTSTGPLDTSTSSLSWLGFQGSIGDLQSRIRDQLCLTGTLNPLDTSGLAKLSCGLQNFWGDIAYKMPWGYITRTVQIFNADFDSYYVNATNTNIGFTSGLDPAAFGEPGVRETTSTSITAAMNETMPDASRIKVRNFTGWFFQFMLLAGLINMAVDFIPGTVPQGYKFIIGHGGTDESDNS